MLLNLDDSLLETEDLERRDKIADCISNILLGFYEANILVQASDELYDFYEPFVTDNRAKRALAYLKANNSYAYDIEPFNVVNKEPKKVKTSQREMSIFFFEKTISVQKAIILGENANDASFYGYLAHNYYPNVRLSYQKAGGGGSTTSDVLVEIQKQNERFCLVIADSDKRYPNAPMGGTAESVGKVWNRNLTQIGVYTIAVHEVENLLPVGFVKKKSETNKEARIFLSKLLKSKNLKFYWRYYDIKEGVCISEIESSADYYSFAEKLYKEVYGTKQSFEKYLAQLKLPKKEKKVFPIIRGDLLDKFVSLKELDKIKFPMTLFVQECKDIAQKVVEFACCRSNDDPLNI